MRAKRTGAINPYEVLGVSTDAGAEDIKAAYRKRAKESHPDAGGSSEEFAAVKSAHVVLSNPVKRKRFDATGEIDADAPDNTEQGALQVIGELLQAIITGDVEPEYHDVVEAMRRTINAKIAKFHEDVAKLTKATARLERLRGRFRRNGAGPNTLERMLDWHSDAIAQAKMAASANITRHERALEILRDYSFAQAFQASIPSFFAGRSSASANATGFKTFGSLF